MENQPSDTDRQILDLWEAMKPREATALKFIVMDESGTFAGQFTCSIDFHGDRYFLIQQAPRSGKWTLSSNLVANLEAAEKDLPKTAVRSREEYKAAVSRSIYRLDVDLSSHDNSSEQSSSTSFRQASNEAQPGIPESPYVEEETTLDSTLPDFDYSPREGLRPNTDEWGKANIMICANFAIATLLYVINNQAQINKNSKGSRSVSTDVAWGAVLLLASELDQEMENCLKIVESSIKDFCFSKLVEDRLCRMLPNGEFELEGEVQGEKKSSEEFEECELEGLNFPMLTEFSPERIQHYAFNRNEWFSDYPSGAENWQKVVTHFKLLNENRITGSTSNNGLWLYTANKKGRDLDQKDWQRTISDEKQAIIAQSIEKSGPGNSGPLTGQALIKKVKTLGNASPQELAKACGYVTKANGSEYIDVESYYAALYEAYRS
jgi:hypothetical protein